MTHKCCRSHTWYISGGSAVREFLPLAGKSSALWTPIRRLPSDRKLPFMSFSSFWGFIQNEIWRTGQILWALGAERQLNKLIIFSSEIKIWLWTLLFLIRSPLEFFNYIRVAVSFCSTPHHCTHFLFCAIHQGSHFFCAFHLSCSFFIWAALFISSDNSQQRLDSLRPTQFSEQRNSRRVSSFERDSSMSSKVWTP